jgi:hypothetical protein
LKELVIQFVRTIYKQGFSTLFVHFVSRIDVDDIGKELDKGFESLINSCLFKYQLDKNDV